MQIVQVISGEERALSSARASSSRWRTQVHLDDHSGAIQSATLLERHRGLLCAPQVALRSGPEGNRGKRVGSRAVYYTSRATLSNAVVPKVAHPSQPSST